MVGMGRISDKMVELFWTMPADQLGLRLISCCASLHVFYLSSTKNIQGKSRRSIAEVKQRGDLSFCTSIASRSNNPVATDRVRNGRSECYVAQCPFPFTVTFFCSRRLRLQSARNWPKYLQSREFLIIQPESPDSRDGCFDNQLESKEGTARHHCTRTRESLR